MRNNFLFIFCTLCLLGFSCSKQPKNFLEYKSWFGDEKNGFVKCKEVNDLIFKVSFRPADLQILNELDISKSYTEAEIEGLKKPYSNSKYFIMEVGTKQEEGSSSENVNSNYHNYMNALDRNSLQLDKAVELVIGTDTISPSLFHYEKGYELGNQDRFIFTFPFNNNIHSKEMTFVYKDKIFNVSTLNFKFTVDEKNLPPLPLKIKNS